MPTKINSTPSSRKAQNERRRWTEINTITVNAPSKKYKIHIGDGLLARTGRLAAEIFKPNKAIILSDSNVAALYSERLALSLTAAGFTPIKFTIPAGEESKNAVQLLAALNFFAQNKLSRSGAVFALGGGVVGDLAGLAAALYMRGVGLVHLPTTLLSAVDSSVGGKTAINLEGGKNLAGVFYQPDMVICDTDTLATLPKAEYSNGCAEVIKYALISDPELLNLISSPANISEIISRCVSIKAQIVADDERDTGGRQLLNFGHTFGHAIEKCSGFTISHGAAVACGMMIITTACAKRGLCDINLADRLAAALKSRGLPTRAPYSVDEIFEYVINDKKRLADKITLVLPRTLGKCELVGVPVAEVREMLSLGLRG